MLQEAAVADDSNEEFPGLSFGIRDLDHNRKTSLPASQQDFPSLGGAADSDSGPKPAGAWGKGSGAVHMATHMAVTTAIAGKLLCNLGLLSTVLHMLNCVQQTSFG